MNIKQYFARFATRVICAMAPKRVKRMIFWASIIGHFKLVARDPSILEKTNLKLKLSKDTHSLCLPESLHWIFWDNGFIDNTLKRYATNRDAASKNNFINSIPNALRYASCRKIERDVDSFLSMHPALI